MQLGPIQVAAGGYSGPEVEQIFRQAEVLCEQFGDSGLHFTVLWNLAGFRMARGELPQRRQLIEQAVAVMKKSTDDDVILMTHDVYAQQLFLEGEFAAAHEQAEYVVSHYSVEQHQHLAEATLETADGLVELSTRYDLHFIPFGMTLKAWAMARLDPDFGTLEGAHATGQVFGITGQR